MSTPFTTLGVVCVIAAITGGGLKALGIELHPLQSLGRQFLLGVLGLVLIGADNHEALFGGVERRQNKGGGEELKPPRHIPGISQNVSKDDSQDQSEAPVSVVRLFYAALAKGDGVSASALVVPEKRGIGPLSELEISRFFGGLEVPLVVEDIRQTGEDTVNVRYRYRKDSSRYCMGNALVTTTNKYGKTLIENIAANC
ncbi:hypothetical protein B0G81_8072 [Paraburkholderia sp. BL6665CI2N2]|uniref:hypothetical protein n=1 Tax=Paraburkholderia sp. BL6665CI2N2 TaxID=1938806 RepID=UPI0010658C44|nr:hypothetical protein [Paraburkholderia sp. BL6665CI2N2]TDY16927.1 hypothetical protein B0G81_8072 [Paraburkholderia sp. BL6665CI2N2]